MALQCTEILIRPADRQIRYETRSKTLFQALYKKYPKSKQAVAQKEKESTLKDKENTKYTLMKSG